MNLLKSLHPIPLNNFITPIATAEFKLPFHTKDPFQDNSSTTIHIIDSSNIRHKLLTDLILQTWNNQLSKKEEEPNKFMGLVIMFDLMDYWGPNNSKLYKELFINDEFDKSKFIIIPSSQCDTFTSLLHHLSRIQKGDHDFFFQNRSNPISLIIIDTLSILNWNSEPHILIDQYQQLAHSLLTLRAHYNTSIITTSFDKKYGFDSYSTTTNNTIVSKMVEELRYINTDLAEFKSSINGVPIVGYLQWFKHVYYVKYSPQTATVVGKYFPMYSSTKEGPLFIINGRVMYS